MNFLKSAARHFLHRLGFELRRSDVRFHNCWADIAQHLAGVAHPLVLDIGANEGQSALQMLEAMPAAKMHCFEPGAAAFEVLERNLAGTGKDAAAHRLAFGSGRGTVSLRVNKFSVTSSLLDSRPEADEDVDDGMKTCRVEEVSMDTVTEWAARNGISHVHLMKTDCQGYDLEVLRGAGPLLASGTVGVVCCEVLFSQLYEGQAWFDETCAFMRGHGYRLLGLYEIFRRPDGVMRWADAVFVK